MAAGVTPLIFGVSGGFWSCRLGVKPLVLANCHAPEVTVLVVEVGPRCGWTKLLHHLRNHKKPWFLRIPP